MADALRHVLASEHAPAACFTVAESRLSSSGAANAAAVTTPKVTASCDVTPDSMQGRYSRADGKGVRLRWTEGGNSHVKTFLNAVKSGAILGTMLCVCVLLVAVHHHLDGRSVCRGVFRDAHGMTRTTFDSIERRVLNGTERQLCARCPSLPPIAHNGARACLRRARHQHVPQRRSAYKQCTDCQDNDQGKLDVWQSKARPSPPLPSPPTPTPTPTPPPTPRRLVREAASFLDFCSLRAFFSTWGASTRPRQSV